MKFTVEYRYLIKSCEAAEIVLLHACMRCFFWEKMKG